MIYRGETQKAFQRRKNENWFTKFAPEDKPGIDIGCQNDPLNQTFRRWDLIFGDGDATLMDGVPNGTFHTVYASHVLEHLQDPITAIRNWFRITASGGHLIVIVPHRDLYEKKKELPSKWNPDHKWFYLPYHSDNPSTLSLHDVVAEAIDSPFTLRVLMDGWQDVGPDVHSDGEYSIEVVVSKR